MYIDLTHPMETGMPIYPDDPIPAVDAFPCSPPWRLTQLRLGSHTGTHIDAASHYIPDGRTIEAYPLELATSVKLVYEALRSIRFSDTQLAMSCGATSSGS